MLLASQIRPGTVLRIGDELFKVIESTYHVGQGKMPGSVHAKLKNVLKGTFKELRWRPEERVEDVELVRQEMEYLYSDADSACFMHPVSYDQVAIPLEVIGPAHKFLKTEMMIPVEFCEGAPIDVHFPPAVEIRVDTTTEPVHQQQDNTYKQATLENGMEVMVPQFIRPGELVRIDVVSGKYLDRVRTDIKRV